MNAGDVLFIDDTGKAAPGKAYEPDQGLVVIPPEDFPERRVSFYLSPSRGKRWTQEDAAAALLKILDDADYKNPNRK